MTAPIRPVPPGSTERLASALPFDTGDALLILYGTGTTDRFCCGDYQERGFEEAIWSLLRSAGYQRIVFCTLNGLYFRDEQSAQLDRGGTVAPDNAEPATMTRFAGPQGRKVVAQTGPPPTGGSAPTMQDPQIIQKLDACMTGREMRTAVVLLRTEDFLQHNQAPRPFIDRIGAWIAAGPSAGNLCVLAFSNSGLQEVHESVQTNGGMGALQAFLSDQRRRRSGSGISRVGESDEAELRRLVHRTRIRDGLRIDDWSRLDKLISAMAAMNQPAGPWIARLQGLARDGMPLSAELLRQREWIERANMDGRTALERLNELIGLSEVRRHLSQRADRVRARKVRRATSDNPPSPHLIFTGNPGTGKTTVARLVGEIYADLGLLRRGHLVVADAPKLIGRFVGQTAPLVNDAVDEALGGVLFIDEAYRLTEPDRGGFGLEAIDALVDRMENDRDAFVVIAAGYPDKMAQFRSANPGLAGRFPLRNVILFADYDPAELLQILTGMLAAADLRWEDGFTADLKLVTEGIYRDRDENFSNARDMRELAAEIEDNWAARVTDDGGIPLESADLPSRLRNYLR